MCIFFSITSVGQCVFCCQNKLLENIDGWYLYVCDISMSTTRFQQIYKKKIIEKKREQKVIFPQYNSIVDAHSYTGAVSMPLCYLG